MNKRIKEIVDQVNIPHQVGDLCHIVSYQELEKFAELIVREMCQVINADCESQYSEGITTNLGGLNQARELIKEHFGVEE